MRGITATTVGFLALALTAPLAMAQAPRPASGATPGWSDESRLHTAMEAFERQMREGGSASSPEKERKLDEAMRLMGLTYRPGPDGDMLRIYFTEAAPSRVRDKIRRVQAAAPGFANRGGDDVKLQGLLWEFEKR